MKRWRYHSMIIRDLSVCEQRLNVEGEKGWELVSITASEGNSARVFFKMPYDDDSGYVADTHSLAPQDVALVSSNPFELA